MGSHGKVLHRHVRAGVETLNLLQLEGSRFDLSQVAEAEIFQDMPLDNPMSIYNLEDVNIISTYLKLHLTALHIFFFFSGQLVVLNSENITLVLGLPRIDEIFAKTTIRFNIIMPI